MIARAPPNMPFIAPPKLLGHLSCAAASGLWASDTRVCVIADDTTRLHIHDRHTLAHVGNVTLFPDVLPDEHREKTAAKPDLEMLTELPGGWLLALGSGSTPRRDRGAAIRIATLEHAEPEVLALDLTPLYAHLRDRVPALNLEGAAVVGGHLRLFQRGNGEGGHNAIVEVDLAGVMAAVAGGRTWGADLLGRVTPIDLGELNGVPLGFTDAAALPGGDVLFTATAEGGGSVYEDGPFGGAVIGRLSNEGSVRWSARVRCDSKIEGLHYESSAGGGASLLLTADADDPTIPAPLFRLNLTASRLEHGLG